MASLTEEVINNLSQDQQNVLYELGQLADKEQKVCEKIDVQLKAGVYSQDGFSIGLCEDMDDMIVMDHPLLKERKNVKKQISETLKKAIDLDLSYLGIIQRQCKNYGVEIS